MSGLFARQRQMALGISLVASCFGWYSLLLLTNPPGVYSPDSRQWLGLASAMVVGLSVWVWKCLTIRPSLASAE